MQSAGIDENISMGMNYCMNIPHYPQRFKSGDWPAGVLFESRDSDYWGDRSCGLACLRMIITYYRKPIPTQYELLVEGVKQNSYTSKGWIHQGLADLGEKYGLRATPIAIENGDELERLLKTKGPLIVSITHAFPEDGSSGGHLIVVCGRHINKQLEATVSFRDPSRWGLSNSIVSEKRFFSSFTGRGIVFSL